MTIIILLAHVSNMHREKIRSLVGGGFAVTYVAQMVLCKTWIDNCTFHSMWKYFFGMHQWVGLLIVAPLNHWHILDNMSFLYGYYKKMQSINSLHAQLLKPLWILCYESWLWTLLIQKILSPLLVGFLLNNPSSNGYSFGSNRTEPLSHDLAVYRFQKNLMAWFGLGYKETIWF